MMKKLRAMMVGFGAGMVVGLTSTKLQCKMCEFWEDMMVIKNYRRLPECTCECNKDRLSFERVQKDLETQLSKLKRVYKELMKADLTEEIRGKIRNLFRGIENLIDKIRIDTSEEELEY